MLTQNDKVLKSFHTKTGQDDIISKLDKKKLKHFRRQNKRKFDKTK